MAQWSSVRVAGSRLNGGSALCSEQDTIFCLVLVQPRKTGKCPNRTEKLLTGT